MADKSKVKVIKRDEIVPTKRRKNKRQTPRGSAREMVSTVTDWVTDLKQRKSDETKAALDLLMGRTTRPTGS